MMPLICSFQETDWSWWLLDSGAAVSVLSENFCQSYRYKGGKTGVGSVEYFAANGSPVRMSQTAAVSVAFEVTTGAGVSKVQTFQLECCIGNVSHNIISTGQLVKKGWTVVQSPDEMYLYHAESQTMITDMTLWGGCPWMRSRRPTAAKAIKDQPGKSMPMDVDGGGAPMDVSGLKVSESQAERRRQHVLKGHYPYDPHCLECQQGRGVSRAPRRPMRERALEIQADFFFLGTHKLVLFRQVMTGLLGVTAVSEDTRVTGSHIRQILAEFSLVGGEGPPIDFRTDAAPDVTALIQRSGIPREYTVTCAGPQNVREVKEGIATIRLELAKENCDLQDSLAGWEACARYVVAMHNLHGKVENTGKTGCEVLRDSVEASRVSAMFCSHVLAETPESVPSVGRFVSAGYLYPVRNSFSHFVVAKIEDDLKYFQAKSLKFVFPITYPMDLVGRFLRRTGSEPPPGPIEDQSPVEIIPEDFAKLPDSIPPPRHWLDKFGNTDDCTACATRKGKHSVKCYDRYRNWLRRGDEKKQEDKKPPVPAPVADEELSHELPQEPPPVAAKDVVVITGLPKGMAPTKGCPSCDSGVVAPGIRHSAKCKKSQAQFLEASSMHVEKATSYRDPPKAVEDELANYAAEMEHASSDLEKDRRH